MDKNFNSILVFDRPITLKDDDGSNWTAYGFVYDNTVCVADGYDYVKYLVGLEQWFSMGNKTTLDNTWIDNKTGLIYKDKDEYVRVFCWSSFYDNPVSFFCKNDIQITLPEDCLDNSFIINENYWRDAVNMILDLNVAEQKAKREQIENNNDDEDDGLPF